MKKSRTLPVVKVRELFDYDSNTGVLTWKVNFPNGRSIGSIAGHYDKINGYRRLKFDGIKYLVHRLIWVHYYSDDPSSKFIDHINGIRDDNRIANLRLVDDCENQWNAGATRKNKSGFRGVYYRAPWGATIKVRGKYINLGFFETKEEAAEAYRVATLRYYGEFAPTEQRAPAFG
jgi:hypothetical protein